MSTSQIQYDNEFLRTQLKYYEERMQTYEKQMKTYCRTPKLTGVSRLA